MSVDQYVYLRRDLLPSSSEWQKAVDEAGLEIKFDDFVIDRQTGFLPVIFKGSKSGFEFSVHNRDDGEDFDEIRVRVGERDTIAAFYTHSDLVEFVCAYCAAAVLAKLADGVYYDPQEGVILSGQEALARIPSVLHDVKADLISHKQRAQVDQPTRKWWQFWS